MSSRRYFFLLFCAFSSGYNKTETVGEFLIKQTLLVDNLLNGYRREIPPIYLRDRYDNVSRVMNMRITFMYGKLLSINEPEQTAYLISECFVHWTDFRLQWNPDEWDDIKMLMISRKLLWIPDAMPMDLTEYEELRSSEIQNVIVHSNGSCTLYIVAIMKMMCKLNIKNFPFDKQTCAVKIASANFLTSEISFSSDVYRGFDIKEVGNGAWETYGVSMSLETFRNEIYGWEFPRVVYRMTMKRSSTYYVVMIVIPSIFLTSLTVLGMFWTEINDQTYLKKLSLGFSAFLSQTMLLQITTQNMPKTSHLPALSIFILCNLMVLTASIISTLITAKYLHYRCNKELGEPRNNLQRIWRFSLHRIHVIYMFTFLVVIAINLLVLLT